MVGAKGPAVKAWRAVDNSPWWTSWRARRARWSGLGRGPGVVVWVAVDVALSSSVVHLPAWKCAQRQHVIVPTRCVRTNKNDGLVGKDFLAKSGLVVQGFEDRSLGEYRRDAPTASAIAGSICLAISAFHPGCQTHQECLLQWKVGETRNLSGSPSCRFPGLRPGQCFLSIQRFGAKAGGGEIPPTLSCTL